MAPMTTAAAVVVAFAAWAEVTPTTLTVTVPEFSWVGPVGAAQPRDWRIAKPAKGGCPEYDQGGKVIGWVFDCQDAGK